MLNANWKEQRDEPNKLKILTTQSWFETTYHPYVADALVEGTSNLRSTGGPDTKWTISRNGRYRLTVNTFKETMHGEYLGATESTAKDYGSVTYVDAIQQNTLAIRVGACHGNINIVYASSPADVTVLASSGQLVASRSAVSKGVVATNLAKGVYVVRATADSNSVVKKVVIN